MWFTLWPINFISFIFGDILTSVWIQEDTNEAISAQNGCYMLYIEYDIKI